MFEKYLSCIENAINEHVTVGDNEFNVVQKAMQYSIAAGGKRVRPCIMLEFADVCGADANDILPFAVALEMIHTYSLIHDDLPCMDNDDLRRGKPSCHIAFGEATALLAGDALLTDAFSVALKSKVKNPKYIADAIAVLADCAGSYGMIGGQIIDLKYEETTPTFDAVKQMYLLKTGKLLVAAAKIGCILSGADEKLIKNAEIFAENLGLAFQIKDDILDIESSASVLGKPIGSDLKSNKKTYVSFVGLEQAKKDVIELTNTAIKSLDCFGDRANNLKNFALKLADRKN